MLLHLCLPSKAVIAHDVLSWPNITQLTLFNQALSLMKVGIDEITHGATGSDSGGNAIFICFHVN